jgi:membrane-associated phospholipid phosphatase
LKNKLIDIKNYLFVWIFFASAVASAQNVDIDILRSINQNRNRSFDNSLIFITNSDWPVTISTPTVLFIAGAIKKDKNLMRKGFDVGATQVTSAVIATTFKYSINRTRPHIQYQDIENVVIPGSPSFPSGHTSSSFALATSLSINFPRWYVILPTYAYAATVSYSRLHLGVHYPSDVLAGAIIGTGSAFLTHHTNKFLRSKWENKKSKRRKPIED